MEKARSHLSLEDRRVLYTMLASEEGFTYAAIGEKIGKAASTVCCEIHRNEPENPFVRQRCQASPLDYARYADDLARARQRSKSRKEGGIIARCFDVQGRILKLLEHTNHSPETIADILSRSDLGVKLSGKTIRRWIKKHHPDYQKKFPHRGKRRCHLTPKRINLKGSLTPVHDRPDEALERIRPGDLELDLIVSSLSKVCILSVRDRATRRCWLLKIDNKEAATTRQAIIKILNQIHRHTCTYDRGGEFAEVQILEKVFQIKNYFCDPYAAWQKGSVEQQNKEVRRFIGKKTDLATISDERLKQIEEILNHKPRRVLNGLSALDAWLIAERNMRAALH